MDRKKENEEEEEEAEEEEEETKEQVEIGDLDETYDVVPDDPSASVRPSSFFLCCFSFFLRAGDVCCYVAVS